MTHIYKNFTFSNERFTCYQLFIQLSYSTNCPISQVTEDINYAVHFAQILIAIASSYLQIYNTNPCAGNVSFVQFYTDVELKLGRGFRQLFLLYSIPGVQQ
jgi:hypothetical protein